MNPILSILPLTLPAIGSPAIPQSQPASAHYILAQELIELLHATDNILSMCYDAESIRQAIPQLETQRMKMNAIAVRQGELPDPTAEEEKEVLQLKDQFNAAWNNVSGQIDRLILNGLITRELADVLSLDPSLVTQQPAPPAATGVR